MFQQTIVRTVIEQQIDDLEQLWGQKYIGFSIEDVLDSVFTPEETYITYDASCIQYDLMNVHASLTDELLFIELFNDRSGSVRLEAITINVEDIEIDTVGPYNTNNPNYKG